jgi:PhnB protein
MASAKRRSGIAQKILGGQIVMMMRYADAPAGAGAPQTTETANRIMHARLQVGDRFLMGGDAPPQFASKPQGFCVSIQVDDPAKAERIFGELSEGGVVQMPIGETFWARRFGMLIDKFGTPWMVNCERPTT